MSRFEDVSHKTAEDLIKEHGPEKAGLLWMEGLNRGRGRFKPGQNNPDTYHEASTSLDERTAKLHAQRSIEDGTEDFAVPSINNSTAPSPAVRERLEATRRYHAEKRRIERDTLAYRFKVGAAYALIASFVLAGACKAIKDTSASEPHQIETPATNKPIRDPGGNITPWYSDFRYRGR